MPNTKSAKKAMRSSLKKQGFNLEKKFKIKNALKDARKAISMGVKDTQPILSKVFSTLDKAVKTKFIHKNRANRKKSRIAKMFAKLVS